MGDLLLILKKPDVGGGATAEAIKQAFTLITGDPKVTSIFVNIFGGIVRCDAIAQGLISVVKSMNLHIPIIARLQGTNMEQAHQLVCFVVCEFLTPSEPRENYMKYMYVYRSINVLFV